MFLICQIVCAVSEAARSYLEHKLAVFLWVPGLGPADFGSGTGDGGGKAQTVWTSSCEVVDVVTFGSSLIENLKHQTSHRTSKQILLTIKFGL